MEFHKAQLSDVPSLCVLAEEAKLFLKDLGVDQWQGEYPSSIDFTADIEADNCYVVTKDDEVIASTFLSFANDPTYSEIDGEWSSSEKYGVIHRLMISNQYKGLGVSNYFLKKLAQVCIDNDYNWLRIDTHEDNIVMDKFLKRNGFIITGVIIVEDGTKRIAYDLKLK